MRDSLGKVYAYVYIFMVFGFSVSSGQVHDIESFVRNFENGAPQEVLTGSISSYTISKPQVDIILENGEITLLDFGMGKPCAMIFKGIGRIKYTPPDDIEAYQLDRFTGKELIDDKFSKALFMFTDSEGIVPDMSNLTVAQPAQSVLDYFRDACDDGYHHLGVYLPNELLDGLTSENASEYLYFDLPTRKTGHLVFRESPVHDDLYRIYNLKRSAGVRTADVFAGYSPDGLSPVERGAQAIDITHYEIRSRIESDGEMVSSCRIHYTPLVKGKRFLYFDWYYDITILSIKDDKGRPLQPVFKKEGYRVIDVDVDESGIGLYLNSPTVAGEENFIDFEYESDCLDKWSSIFYVKTTSRWYPQTYFRDVATFDLTFDTPEKYEVISCGKKVSSEVKDGRLLEHYLLDIPSQYVSFNVGSFRSKKITAEGYPMVEVYLTEEIADASGGGVVITVKDRLGNAGADIMNSLAFFTSFLGPCPFDTLKATSIPYSHGQGSPGLVYLSMDTFLEEDLDGYNEAFRAHEVAHQWWGHVIDSDDYHDNWIIEGLAEYCGLWFYQASGKNKKAFDNMLEYYRGWIKSGTGIGSTGIDAGPVVLGDRLKNTQTDDYVSQVYYKGAYIFHMIRYILYDYKSESDERFVAFLQDLIERFKSEPITTEKLKQVLEIHCNGDMGWFFDQWVYGRQYPKYKFKYDITKTDDGKSQVTCFIKQKNVPENFKMLVPITLVFDGGRYVHYKIWVDKPELEMTFPAMSYKTKNVIFNTYDAVLGDVH